MTSSILLIQDPQGTLCARPDPVCDSKTLFIIIAISRSHNFPVLPFFYMAAHQLPGGHDLTVEPVSEGLGDTQISQETESVEMKIKDIVYRAL
jgi:hypothetical protein